MTDTAAESRHLCLVPKDKEAEPVSVAKEWSIYRHGELRQRCEELGTEKELIGGLLPNRSLALLVGDSGLGKSPLVYQMGLCVASGKPFLGRPVQQGKVLCLDFENGLRQVETMVTALCSHLSIDAAPDDLLLWNYNDSSENYGQKGHTALNMIRAVEPDLVTVDSLTGLYPDIEDRNPLATKAYQELRLVMRDCGASVLALHHLRKPGQSDGGPPALDGSDTNVRQWFLQARGAGVLINGSDVRLGVDLPRANCGTEAALALRGFGRVSGEIPQLYLARTRDDDGEPLGYDILSGPTLLFNQEQQAAYEKLPKNFSFKEARGVYGKQDQATTDFLKKCIGLDLLRKVARGKYEKPSGVE